MEKTLASLRRRSEPGKYNIENYPDIAIVKFLDIEYLHLKCSNGGDLYVTKYGISLIEQIKPENWYDDQWFRANREKLRGTSTVYKVTSKKVNGKNAELIVKWSRVGQYVPLETKVIEDVLNAEFNSPFEEFSLVEELRRNVFTQDINATNMSLQKPLGIYVPPNRLQLWQTGRSKHKIKSKLTQHPGVEIDLLRQYILIYKWVRGIDAVEAFEKTRLPEEQLFQFTDTVTANLKKNGFRVLDNKPAHFIVKLRPDKTLMKDKKGVTPFALVDFELLQRTPEHEEEVKKVRRTSYLVKQRDRFIKDEKKKWPHHLHAVNIIGVNYVWGIAESTNGMLWVVGDDPDLFDYFLPERWRKTPRTTLSPKNDIYYTKTKDNINIVWKISRVGEKPDVVQDERGKMIINHGYNSPFEKFSLAVKLSKSGISTVYPRAIYMTGNSTDLPENIVDESRFISHNKILAPDNKPVLKQDHDYITLWGFWNGSDDLLANEDVKYCTGISALNAFRRELITDYEFFTLLEQIKKLLHKNGYENVGLKGNHILLSMNSRGELIKDIKGRLEFHLCNFEFIRPLRKKTKNQQFSHGI